MGCGFMNITKVNNLLCYRKCGFLNDIHVTCGCVMAHDQLFAMLFATAHRSAETSEEIPVAAGNSMYFCYVLGGIMCARLVIWDLII